MRPRTYIVLIIIAGITAGLVLWSQRDKPVAVIVADVEVGEVERTVTNTRAGTLNACRRARLSPSIGGQIANLPVREGETVKQGQVLFEIWNDDVLAQIKLAQSELSSSRALRDQACIQADIADRESRRLKELLAQRLASTESAEKADGLARAQRAACDAASANMDIASAKIDVTRAALARTRLVAPFDGTIAEVNGELGEYVTPSPVGIPTPPAIDLIDTSCLYIGAPIDEVDAPAIRAGMNARISLDAFAKTFFEGKVRRVAPYVLDKEKQARTVDVEVDFVTGQTGLNLLPGYTADIEVIIDAHNDVVRIPSEALAEGNHVYVYDPDFSSISRVEVKTGLSNWRHTEISDGLQAGQRIVTSIDREGLVDGALVKIETE
jgi:HlyD family secretion protein